MLGCSVASCEAASSQCHPLPGHPPLRAHQGGVQEPGLNLTNMLDRLPEDVDHKALEELVAPIVDLVDQAKRVEGQRRH